MADVRGVQHGGILEPLEIIGKVEFSSSDGVVNVRLFPSPEYVDMGMPTVFCGQSITRNDAALDLVGNMLEWADSEQDDGDRKGFAARCVVLVVVHEVQDELEWETNEDPCDKPN